MQRWVYQPDDHRVALAGLLVHHGLKDALEVAALEGQQLVQCSLSFFLALGQDHPLYDGQALLLHKHMLGAAEANAFGSKGYGTFRIAGIVGVGPYAKPAVLVGP